MADRSVLRYEKSVMVQRELGKLTQEMRDYAAILEQNLASVILDGKLPAGCPWMPA